MEDNSVFKTKTGYCHVLPDNIVLTREGAIGQAAEAVAGNNIARPLALYGLFTAGLAYLAYDYYLQANYGLTGFFSLLVVLLAYGILRSLNNSAQPVLDRKHIQRVSFRPGLPGLTRAHFEVTFLDARGKQKKRLIMLPGSLSDGKAETEKAVSIMRAEKLLS
ncbi:phosphoribosylaminoimidazolesuccinocarboxamide synthase [Hymenobacter jeollabukensis]|uniref:Phosphoribosylaminoimidazolesuccinocarboxamide synthase n=1 Tax=Hymenobacter jeollabukensis TaxID=2025313 RepID=A0A5R8WRF4_9BACT|nr:phosphoribosylaminoimidazolesuccinocarboxamide synthase [Hymenobacter jeollabukensis]TLM93327.1 phosphoribosylaminoimidazolesuccinocarboxamide synthase [Hymenobacter jeollabukensis]